MNVSARVPGGRPLPVREKARLFKVRFSCEPSLLARKHLVLRTENRILCRLSDAEFDNGLSGNLNLLLRLGVEPGASFPLLFYELSKPRHDEFAALSGSFVGDRAERIKEYTGCLFTRLRSFGKGGLKFCLVHLGFTLFQHMRLASSEPRKTRGD
jgi:hypothetical protein